MKKILQPILFIIVALGIAVFVWDKVSPNATTPPVATPAASAPVDPSEAAESSDLMTSPTSADAVVVTYFTTDVRCVSCKKIESLIRETLERDFAKALESGRLRFQTINIDRSENKHFADRYELSFKTVVVSGPAADGAADWEKLDDVWRLLNAPEDFADYVGSAVTQRLDHKS